MVKMHQTCTATNHDLLHFQRLGQRILFLKTYLLNHSDYVP